MRDLGWIAVVFVSEAPQGLIASELQHVAVAMEALRAWITASPYSADEETSASASMPTHRHAIKLAVALQETLRPTHR
jgi:hypothetical protein